LLIFVGGAVSGVILDRHFGPRVTTAGRYASIPETERPDYLLKEFTATMNLAPEQQQRVGALLREWSKVILSHPEWTRARRVSFIVSNRSLMLTNLTAEQSLIYDRTLERMRRPRRGEK